MDEPWVPPLRAHEQAGRCRLALVGLTYGDGGTLQEAADDLIARLLALARTVRTSGLVCSSEIPPPEPRVLAFIWEIGERAAAGQDVRERVFGPLAGSDTSA
jgi:hypothetical protein